MGSKRKLELTCGLITGALGISVAVAVIYITQVTAQILDESPPVFSAVLFGGIFYHVASSRPEVMRMR